MIMFSGHHSYRDIEPETFVSFLDQIELLLTLPHFAAIAQLTRDKAYQSGKASGETLASL
jgi:hypothetical protein